MALLTGAGAIALLEGSAHAATVAAASDSSAAAEVGEVVVTANRSGAENLQNVAIAVTAVNTETLDKAGATSFLDLTKYTPSLSITQGAPGFNKFDLRGLDTGAYRTSDTSDRPTVAVYLDDTPISLQGQTPDLRVYDLERVEVLAGPQGTLYGAGSLAGTVRFITAKPSAHDFFGTVEIEGSSTEHGSGNYNFRGVVNVPLIRDQLAVRATVYQGEDSGFISNIGDRNKRRANLDRTTQFRVAARWTPTEKLTVDASVTYEKSRAYGLDQQLSGLAPYTISSNGPEGDRDDFQLYSITGRYDVGFADFVETSSYTYRRIGFQASPDPQIGYFFQSYPAPGAPPPPTFTNTYPLYNAPTSYNQAVTDLIPREDYLITQKIHDFTQEIRLVSHDGGPVRWTVGAFYESQRRNLYQDIPTPGFDTLSYENYFYGPFNTSNGLYNSKTVDAAFNTNDIFSGIQNTDEYQVAIFTDDTWHVTKRLDLTAGVRYFNFHEKYFLFESGVYGVLNHIPLTQNSRLSSNGFNPRFNVSYHATDDVLVYAEAAQGFRYGGANQPVPVGTSGIAGQCAQNLASYGFTSAPATFGPDHLWSYSVGEKARFAGGRVTFNTDLYYIDWSNVQTRLLLNCSYFFTNNAGKIRSEGLETSSIFKITPEITLSTSFAYNDSRANGNIPTVGAFNGDLTPYYPRFIIGVSAYYDRRLGNGDLHLQATWQHRGDEHTTFNPLATINCPQTGPFTAPCTPTTAGQLLPNGPSSTFAVIPSSDNVDASITYNIGNYELGLFGRNLADGVYVTDIGRATYYKIYQAGDRETVARPRTVGARLKVKF